MADPINTADHETPLPPRPLHEAGSFVAQCVDVINLGKKPDSFEGEDKGLQPKLALVFRTGELDSDGKPIDLSVELTISTGRKATLRKWAEAWRGEEYPEDYPDIPVHKFEGVWAIITVAHKKSGKGNTYAKITGVTKLAKGQKGGESFLPAYERAEWWQKRKDEYAKETAAYLAKHQPKAAAKPASEESFEDFPAAMEDGEDDLPF